MNSIDTAVIEFQFIYKIKHPNFAFAKIKQNLISGVVGKGGYSNYPNPIQFYTRDFVLSKFQNQENVRGFFLNFDEKSGSYIIEFVFLVVANSVINYGAIRQSLDYIKKDYNATLENILGAEYQIDSELLEFHIVQKSRKKREPWFEIKNKNLIKVVSTIIGIFFIAFFLTIFSEVGKSEKNKIDENEVKVLINKELDEIIRQKKIDFIINNFPLNQKDTVFIVK